MSKYVVVVDYTDQEPGEENAKTLRAAKAQAKAHLAYPTATAARVYREADYGVTQNPAVWEVTK